MTDSKKGKGPLQEPNSNDSTNAQAELYAAPRPAGENKSAVPSLIPTSTRNPKVEETKPYPTTQLERDCNRLRLPWRAEELNLSEQFEAEFAAILRRAVLALDDVAAGYDTSRRRGKVPSIEDFAFNYITEQIAAGRVLSSICIKDVLENDPTLFPYSNTGLLGNGHYRNVWKKRTAVTIYSIQLREYYESGQTGIMPSIPDTGVVRSSSGELKRAAIYNKVFWNMADSKVNPIDYSLWRQLVAHVSKRIPRTSFSQTGNLYTLYALGNPNVTAEERKKHVEAEAHSAGVHAA